MSALPDYGGRTVASTTISIRNAGDGLSKGMAIQPAVLDQVLKAGVATLVDADLVRNVVDEQRERILAAEEAKKGLQRLPYADDGELGLAHARGEHDDSLAEGCPVCDQERDAALAEQDDAPAEPATPITRGRRKRAAAQPE